MIYRGTRKIVKLALAVFFKRIVVKGADNIPSDGPIILAANHPNTLMDPLIVAAITGRRIGFVANASLFASKIIHSLFNFFHVIPIYRKKDVKPGEKPDNDASFAKCYQYLSNGGALLIFPEGSSYHELKLREIKTGTARIALGFEASKKFEYGLKIVPIALDYSDALQFNSIVSVTVSEPISIEKFKEQYLQKDIEAVHNLTEEIRKSLAKHIPQTSGKDQEDFLIKAHRFYACYYEPGADLYFDPSRSLELRSQLSVALKHVYLQDISLYESIQKNINIYFEKLKSSDLTTGFFTEQFNRKNPFLVSAGYFSTFILLLPFYIFGLITNYIPYILPSQVFSALKMEIEYKSSVQLVTGVITFPLFYAIEVFLFRKFVSADIIYTLGFLVMLPLTGYIAMYFWTEVKRFARVLNYYFNVRASQKKQIMQLRNEIMDSMNAARSLLN